MRVPSNALRFAKEGIQKRRSCLISIVLGKKLSARGQTELPMISYWNRGTCMILDVLGDVAQS